jgi:hypothetical protein
MDMDKNKIPPQLRKDGFGFVKLKPLSNIPSEINWQNKPYSYRDIRQWINQGGNYGVLGGRGGLIVVDADSPVIDEIIKKRFPETFTVRTPKNGHHYYFLCEDIDKKIVLKKDNAGKDSRYLGEIITNCSQVAGPGSIHPDTGMVYQVVNDVEIATINSGLVYSEFMEYISSRDQLTELEERIEAIPHDTQKTKIPSLLDPVLKEMACLNQAQAEAILKHTIKDHFGFTNYELKSYEKVLRGYRKDSKDIDLKRLTREDLIGMLISGEGSLAAHPAQDFIQGVMSFAVSIKNTSCIVTSDKRLCPFDDTESEGIALRHKTVDTARFSYKGIRTFLENNVLIDIPNVYSKVHNYIKRFICFPEDAYLSFISLWVMGTYLFMIFRYYPYVWLNAEKGSGKTLLMEILSNIAFNGELISNPTESVIFRDISNNLITMFIDEVEQLRKRDKDVYGSVISVLNAGFNKAGVVKRTESIGKGGFVVRAYSAYSPKMFAGINEIDDVLQDRTIRIPLLRKKDGEIVERYKATAEIVELQRNIRDDLYVFALDHAGEIAEVYYAKDEGIQGLGHLNNRELDIWEPIFLLANVVDMLSGSMDLTGQMEELSRKSIEEKRSDNMVQNETYKTLSVLKIMLDDVAPLITDGDKRIFDANLVLAYFKTTEEFDWIEKMQSLTRRLKRVKVMSEQKRIEGDRKRTYTMRLTEFNDLCDRFGI